MARADSKKRKRISDSVVLPPTKQFRSSPPPPNLASDAPILNHHAHMILEILEMYWLNFSLSWCLLITFILGLILKVYSIAFFLFLIIQLGCLSETFSNNSIIILFKSFAQPYITSCHYLELLNLLPPHNNFVFATSLFLFSTKLLFTTFPFLFLSLQSYNNNKKTLSFQNANTLFYNTSQQATIGLLSVQTLSKIFNPQTQNSSPSSQLHYILLLQNTSHLSALTNLQNPFLLQNQSHHNVVSPLVISLTTVSGLALHPLLIMTLKSSAQQNSVRSFMVGNKDGEAEYLNVGNKQKEPVSYRTFSQTQQHKM